MPEEIARREAERAAKMFCDECGHTYECDDTRGGEHGPEVDFMDHRCPGV
jgi:hypothetical protein